MEKVLIYFTHLDREPLSIEGGSIIITEIPTGFKITNDRQTDELILPAEGVVIAKQITQTPN